MNILRHFRVALGNNKLFAASCRVGVSPTGLFKAGSIGRAFAWIGLFTILSAGRLLAAVPAINSAATATGQVGVAFSYQIVANHAPTSFAATGLPAGVMVDTTTGLISGTPTTVDVSTVTLSATNAGGTGTKTLTLTINPPTPVITSALIATGQVGVAFSYQIVADNSPTSFAATGLPAGVTIDTTTGLISGTPTTAVTKSVTLKATNAGGTGTAVLALTINPANPVISSAATATGQVGIAFSYQIVANHAPTSFAAAGLPAGVTVDTTTGLISGTPTTADVSTVTLSATNAGGTGTKTLTLTINPPTPVITSALTATGQVGVAFSYQIVADNFPTSFDATGLPAGVTIDTTTGLLSGTPTTAATKSVTLKATNAGGTGTAVLALTINPANPVISSAATATGQVGVAFSYRIVANHAPTSFDATGLPAGVTVDTTTGLISGTPTTVAVSTVTLSATNAGGIGIKTLTLTINPPTPVITSVLTATGQVGVAFSYQIVADNSPASFAVTGLPAGLAVDTTTGLISGTPTAARTKNVTIKATNAGGTGTAVLALTINRANPVINSAATATGQVGVAFSYRIVASHAPTSFDATGLPAGLTINTMTGLISGTPTTAAVSTVTLSATNAGGTGTKTLTLTINPPTPVITSALTATELVGVPFSYQIVADNSPTSFGATGLPAGVAIDTTSGLISGTPTTADVSSVTLSATNAGGTGTAVLTLTINPLPTATVSNGLQAWYRADLGVTKDADSKVSQWADLSGHGVHVEQSVISEEPMFAASAIGGLPAVQFARDTDLASALADLQAGSTDVSVIMVTRPVANQGYTSLVDWNDFGVGNTNGNQYFMLSRDASNGAHGYDTAMEVSGGDVQLMEYVKAGTQTSDYLNGVLKVVGTNASSINTGTSQLMFGRNNSGWRYAGQIAEVLVYNRAINDVERAQIEAALTAKYTLNDTNGNGIPDSWERQNLGTLQYGANDDPGGVGRTLLQSYQQGLSPWPSAAVSTGLQAWYRADLGVTKDADSKVSQWADVSGHGAHVMQSVTSEEPVLAASAIGGLPAVQFTRDTDLASALADLQAGSTDVSVIVVTRPVANQGYTSLLDWGNFGVGNTTGDQYFMLSRDASNGAHGYDTAMEVSGGDVQLMEYVKAGTQTSDYLNGVLKVVGTNASSINTGTSQLMFGRNSSGWRYAGQIAEVLVYNRAINDVERQQIEAALTAKYTLNDANNNGIPDAWERQNLGTLQYGANDDPGGVGRTLLQSYQQGLSPWPSATVSSGLQAWYRADLGVTKDADSKVSQWADVSGHGVHLEQSDANQEPVLAAGVIGGLPAVQFTRDTDLVSALADVQAGSTDVSVIVVSQQAANQGYTSLLDYGNDYGNFAVGNSTGDQYYMNWADTSGGTHGWTPVMDVPGSNVQLMEFVKTGAQENDYLDGVLQAVGTDVATMTTTASQLQLGLNSHGWRYAGQIAEVLVYNRALSDAERAQIETALTTKYNLNDTDGDGLPDAWELKNLGTLQYGPNDDPGGVGRTLLQSYQQGLSPWPSATVNSGLRVWYRADLGMTKDVNNKVSEWTDLSGNGAHVIQRADPARQPSWVAGGPGNKPAVSFDGNVTALQTPGLVDLFGGSNNASVIVVFNPSGTQQPGSVLLDSNDEAFRVHEPAGATNQFELLWRGPNFDYYAGGTVDAASGQPQILDIVKNGADLKGYLNGALQTDTAIWWNAQPEFHQGSRSLTIGAMSNELANFNGQIAEVLIYNRAISDAERQQIEAALGQNYSIILAPSMPMFTPPAGSYTTAQSVSITSAGATSIYYTIDGSTPTTSSTLYAGSLSISTTTTLNAIGVNAGGSSPVASGIYTINLNPPSPVVGSAATATGQVGVAFSYQIVASNAPTSFSATGLPAGLTVDTTTGLISGTPTTAGTLSVTLSATNAGGTGTAVLTLTLNPSIPVIHFTSPASFNDSVNTTTLHLIGTVTDPSAVTLTINGTAVPLGAGGAFDLSQPLPLEGANQLTISAQNTFNKTTTLTYTVYRITQAPSLTITSPATDPFSTRLSSLQVTGTVGSSATQLLVNSVPVTNFSTGAFSQLVTLVPGNNTITVQVQDALGNSRAVQRTMILDQTPPTFANLTPQNGFITNSRNLTVTGTVVDGQTLAINGQNVALSFAGAFSTTITLAEGSTVITLQAQDAVGNFASQTISGQLDTIAPVVVLNAPLPATTVTTSSVVVSGTVDDPAATLMLNGASLVNNNGTFSTNVALTADQTTLTVQARDAAGNTGSKSVSVSRDITPPVVAFTAPANGSATRTATVQVTGTVDNPAATVTVNGLPAVVSAGRFVLSNFVLVDGANVLNAVATDPFGLTSAPVSITINLNRTPPAMPVLTNAPTYIKTDRVTLTGTAQAGSTVTIEGGLVSVSTTADSNGAFSATVLVTPNKSTNLFLSATDAIGNKGDTLVHTIVSDTIPPVITLSHPANGATVNTSVFEVDGAMVDANPSSTITVNGQTVPLSPQGVFGCNLTLPDGTQNIVVTAVDLAGNQVQLTNTVNVVNAANNNPPGIVILSPADGATVPTSNITVTAIVTDALPLTNITASGNPVTGPDANGMITADVTVDSNGQFTVSATDANNTTTVTGHVLVNGNVPAAPTIQQLSASSPTSDSQVIIYASAQPYLAYQITGGLIAKQTGTVGTDGKIVATVPLTPNATNHLQLTVIGANGLSSPPASVDLVQDSLAPAVLQTTPTASATGVALNSTIQIVFNEPVSSAGLSNIKVTLGGGSVAYTLSLSSDQTTVTLTPSFGFSGSVSVQVTVPVTVTDLARNPLASPYTFNFTTLPTAALPLPVVAAPPANSKTNTTVLAITGTAQALSTIKVTGGAAPASAHTDATGHFSVNVTLNPNTSNALQVTANDAFGNVSPAASVTIAHDNQPFVLQSSVPADGATAIAVNTPLTLTFNKPVDPASLTGVSLVGSAIVPTTVSANGAAITLTLAPSSAVLQNGATYQLVLPASVADLFGNRFGTTRHFSFTTAASTTVAVPIVYTAQPTGATNLASVTISGYSNPGTKLLISGGAAPFTFPADGTTIDTTGLFTVNVPLQSNAANHIVLGAQDAQNNASVPVTALDVRQDSVAPTVVHTIPADGAIGVDSHASLFVQFSEAVQAAPLSATIPAIRLFNANNVVVAGNWALSPDGLGATFYSAASLAAGAQYKLLIGTSVRDLAGNPLAAAVPAIFTTAASTAVTKPAAPVLDPLPSLRTTDQTITLTGTAPAGANVRIFGGQTEQDVTADAQGHFAATINLVLNSNDQLVLTSEVGGVDSSFTTTTIQQRKHAAGIRILSPQPNVEYNNRSVTVAGVIDDPVSIATIMVDGQPAAIAGRYFLCQDILDPSPGPKSVNAVATLKDNSTVTASVSFTLNIEPAGTDTKAPIPCFIFPEPGDILTGDVVEAMVTVEEGVQLSSVDIDGVVSHGYTGNIFLIYARLPQQGPNVITVNATDAAGYVGHASVAVVRSMSTFTSAPTVNPVPSLTNVPVVTLTGTGDPGSTIVVMNGLVPVRTVVSPDGTYSVAVPLNPNSSNHLQVVETDSAGNVSPASTVDIAHDDTPPVIVSTSPSAGQVSVAQDASIKVVFSKPINPAAITGAITVQSLLGQTISHNDLLSADGKTLNIVPTYKFLRGDTITVNIAATIADTHGFTLGSADTFSFTTVAHQTTVSGIVIDPQLHPLANVRISIVGSNAVQYTSSFGTFIIDNPPLGNQVLSVDARPDPVTGVTPQGDARIFGYLEYALPIRENVDNSLGHPIFMVDTDTSTASQFAATGDGNVLTFTPALKDLSGFSIIYKGGSAHFADGTNRGSVTVTRIDPENIPERLPSGAIPHFMVGIGPDELTFDTPAQLTFPNVYQLSPGAEVIVFHFKFGIHNYVELGRATVASDGSITTGPMLAEGGFLGIVPADSSFDLTRNILEGRVVDASGNGLAGVSVNAVAGGTYVTTDANGNYSIPLPDVRIALIRTFATISTDFGAQAGGSPSLVFPSALVNLQASGVTKIPDIVVNSFILGGSIRYIDANGAKIPVTGLAYDNQGQLASVDDPTTHGVEIFVYRRISAAGDLPAYDSTPYLRTTAGLNRLDDTYDSSYTLPFLGSLAASSSGTSTAASTIPSPGDVVKVVAFDPKTGFYGESDLTIPAASQSTGITDPLDVTVNLELRPPLLTLDMNRVFFLNGVRYRANIPDHGIAFTSDQYVEFKTTWKTPEVTPLDRPELALSGRLRAISIDYQNDYNFAVRAGEHFRVLELREGIFPNRLSVLQHDTDVGTETVSVSRDGSFADASLVPIAVTTSTYGLAAASTQVTDTSSKNVQLNILNLQLSSDPNGINVTGRTLPGNPVRVAGSPLKADGKGNFSGLVNGTLGAGGVPVGVGTSLDTLFGQALTPVINALDATSPGLVPAIGSKGDHIVINGANFSPVASDDQVSFNGAAAVVLNASEAQLSVVVPDLASTGDVTVTVGGNKSNGVRFEFLSVGINNGSFEDGTFRAFTLQGSGNVIQNWKQVAPTDQQYMAFLDTMGNPRDGVSTLTSDPFVVPEGMQTLLFDYNFVATALFQPIDNVLQFQIVTDTETIQVADLFANVGLDMNLPMSGFESGSGFSTASVDVSSWAGTGQRIQVRVILNGRGAVPAVIPGMNRNDMNPMALGDHQGTGLFLDNFRLSASLDTTPMPLDPSSISIMSDGTHATLSAAAGTLPPGSRVYIWTLSSGHLDTIDVGANGGFTLQAPFDDDATSAYYILSYATPDSPVGRLFSPQIKLGANR